MSYCRFSEDCDVYAYRDLRGYYETHVSDEAFHDDTLEQFSDRLTALRNKGYRIPNSTFVRILAELGQKQERKQRHEDTSPSSIPQDTAPWSTTESPKSDFTGGGGTFGGAGASGGWSSDSSSFDNVSGGSSSTADSSSSGSSSSSGGD